MNNKTKLIGLITIIFFIITLIVSFSYITYFNMKKENEVIKKSTTPNTTTETTTITNESVVTEVTTNHSKSTTTSKKVTTSKVNTTTTELVSDVEIVEDENDEWIIGILNIINDERNKTNLEPLILKKDIHELALKASLFWEEKSEEELKTFMSGYNYYGYVSNILNNVNGYKTIANETINNTTISTNKYLKYVGIGLTKKDNKYYYIIIYE